MTEKQKNNYVIDLLFAFLILLSIIYVAFKYLYLKDFIFFT